MIFKYLALSFTLLFFGCKSDNVKQEKFKPWKGKEMGVFSPSSFDDLSIDAKRKISKITNPEIFALIKKPENDLIIVPPESVLKFWASYKKYYLIADIDETVKSISYSKKWKNVIHPNTYDPVKRKYTIGDTKDFIQIFYTWSAEDSTFHYLEKGTEIPKYSPQINSLDSRDQMYKVSRIPYEKKEEISMAKLQRFKNNQISHKDLNKKYSLSGDTLIDKRFKTVFIQNKKGNIYQAENDGSITDIKNLIKNYFNDQNDLVKKTTDAYDPNYSDVINYSYDNHGLIKSIKGFKSLNEAIKKPILKNFSYTFFKSDLGFFKLDVNADWTDDDQRKFKYMIYYFDSQFNWIMKKHYYGPHRTAHRRIQYKTD